MEHGKSKLEIIMADCHLDNRDSLCEQIGIPAFKWNSVSDEKIILLAYKKWGQNCLQYLFGDFSFAIRNVISNQVFCARDPIGIKPFYYSFSDKCFFCSSNINEVLAHLDSIAEFDEPFISGYLSDKFFAHRERTFFKDIKKLPAGHVLIIESNNERLKRYWFPENVPLIRYQTDKEYAEALTLLLKSVMEDYVRSADPIGVELSGGLDSSVIAVLTAEILQKQSRERPLVYCWEPEPNNKNDNQPYIYSLIRAVCDQTELVPQYCFPTVTDVKQFFKRNPMRNPTTSILFHQLPIQQKAKKQGVGTILSGWGGDQCVTSNGPAYYDELAYKCRWRKLFHEASHLGVSPIRFIAKHTIKQFIPSGISRLKIFNNDNLFVQKTHINREFSRRVKPLCRSVYLRHKITQKAQITRLMDPSFTERLEGSAASGAEHGIVYRYPMLDRRLLEFVLGLPADQFRRGKTSRWIARKSFESILPKEVSSYTDKGDKVRSDAIHIRLSDISDYLSQSIKEIPRSKIFDYVDIDSLRTQLESPEFKKNPKLGQIRNALQLLNSY